MKGYTKLVFLIIGALEYSLCEFTIFSIGDWGETTDCLFNITDKMNSMSAEMNPEFILSVGDNFYQNGVKSVDDRRWVEIFEEPFGKFDEKLKIHSCLGDHDWRGSTTAQIDRTNSTINKRWHLPGYWWYEKVEFPTNTSLAALFEKSALKELSVQDSFHFNSSRSGNSGACGTDCLDDIVDNLNNLISRNSSRNEEPSYKAVMSEYNSQQVVNATAVFIYLDSWTLTQDPFKKTSISYRYLQLEFLEQALRAAISDNVDWIILVTHYSIFSSGHHGPHARFGKLLLPLIKKYKVDYVISGHDHHLELLKPEDLNTHFCINGASSKPRLGFGATHEFSLFKSDLCSFISLTFSKDIAVSRAFSVDSSLFNYFKRSNKVERSKLDIEETNYPPHKSSIRVNPLVNILGLTLSLTPFL
ncbi:Calcineurin-like phosphoesterase family protein [Cryptosporidium felis]|nr:Calcineurin-like phosphoesterase family protein [Cryptosporidium felis]